MQQPATLATSSSTLHPTVHLRSTAAVLLLARSYVCYTCHHIHMLKRAWSFQWYTGGRYTTRSQVLRLHHCILQAV
jgi:hypothetical protein